MNKRLDKKLNGKTNKQFVSDSIHRDIYNFQSMLKRGDMTKIAKKYNFSYLSVRDFFSRPDLLSAFLLNEIYIAVEDFLKKNGDN